MKGSGRMGCRTEKVATLQLMEPNTQEAGKTTSKKDRESKSLLTDKNLLASL